MTASAPAIWGTTYLVTAQFLPPERPLLAAVLRSLPAGLLLLLIVRRLPSGGWWWKALVLGALNIGVFFAFLFVAAYRLPGGVAATIGAVQPLLVSVFAAWWISERLSMKKVALGAAGLGGVALLVLQSEARLDAVGVACALGGALAMAAGVVLSKKWGQPDTLLATTSWQLIGGGLILAPLALMIEGPIPESFTPANVLGYLYLGIVGTAVAYSLWFRGVYLMPAATTALLGLLSPLVAVGTGWIVLHENLAPGQLVGAAIVLATLIAAGASLRKKDGTAAAPALTERTEVK
ncbi:EamA family transporter [Paenarthrobacter nitroguajacolicus]|uniref:EamA family transporter n=1 Tax=Paenarthrobacter nitroguajacolicus TaxID=211146 RepID=UPI0015B97504|nr:EamA family transporter [Paenarthrobacter nitroguajacolicus]NWL13856.1 EamA family transporter [Paenarthrobacter nitroguajacolicus]